VSRIGKKKIVLPSGVMLSVEGHILTVTGPLGALTLNLHPAVSIHSQDSVVGIELLDPNAAGLHGLFRALIFNLVQGVAVGFVKELELFGVGYRAAVNAGNLQLSLGFSHPVVFPAPLGITFAVEGSKILVKGIDKQLVGETASQIFRLRPADAYKGKGVRKSSIVRLKPGKSGRK